MTNEKTSSSDLVARLLEGLPVTERTIDAAGVSTVVLEGGAGPPVVLLHGQGGFGAFWGGLIPHLVGGHRVVPTCPASEGPRSATPRSTWRAWWPGSAP